ncbi:MAG: sodium:proton antiporter [Thermoprotei archaeon]|nr:MAG: sodium:proton antiporter [Thermoprotei archaeon]
MFLPAIVLLIFAFLSVVVTYLAIVERDMLVAAIFMAFQGVCYAIIYYVLMAPDVTLAYIPISSGLTPILILIVLKKTERVER